MGAEQVDNRNLAWDKPAFAPQSEVGLHGATQDRRRGLGDSQVNDDESGKSWQRKIFRQMKVLKATEYWMYF